jgi:hypothetical protein
MFVAQSSRSRTTNRSDPLLCSRRRWMSAGSLWTSTENKRSANRSRSASFTTLAETGTERREVECVDDFARQRGAEQCGGCVDVRESGFEQGVVGRHVNRRTRTRGLAAASRSWAFLARSPQRSPNNSNSAELRVEPRIDAPDRAHRSRVHTPRSHSKREVEFSIIEYDHGVGLPEATFKPRAP